MEFKLNCSPHLRMHEITKKLFNCKFLSDVQFIIKGKTIYAHSLELMKRSEVFVEQLNETRGKKKLIRINDGTYESFLEFVRFVYTDDCTINDRNGIELLKLATKYKVIILENRVINLLKSVDWSLQLFGYCVTDKYEIARHNCEYLCSVNINLCLKHDQFLRLQADAVNAILQLEQVKDVTKVEIFNAVAKWIDTYCKQHKMSLAEGRQKFDQLIRKVRFPAMSTDEIRDCAKKYPELLSDSDCTSIAKQILFGSAGENNACIAKGRSDYVYKREYRKINRTAIGFETKFTVSKDTILHGLWIGVEKNKKEIEIEVTAKNMNTNQNEKVQFIQSAPVNGDEMLISLGNSIRLRRHFEYMIVIKYMEMTDEVINVWCRKENVDLIYNNPDNCIQTINASDNMIEMIFKSAPEQIEWFTILTILITLFAGVIVCEMLLAITTR